MGIATIITMSIEQGGHVMFGIVFDSGRYFYEDGTEVIRSIYGRKVQPRKVAKYLKKYIINESYSASSSEVSKKFKTKLRDVIVAV